MVVPAVCLDLDVLSQCGEVQLLCRVDVPFERCIRRRRVDAVRPEALHKRHSFRSYAIKAMAH